MFGKAKEITHRADRYFHDLAQPLQVIQGTLDILKMDLEDSDIPRAVLLSKLQIMSEANNKACDKIKEARNYLHGKEQESRILRYTRGEFLNYLTGHIAPTIRDFGNIVYSVRRFELDDGFIDFNESFLYNTILNLSKNSSKKKKKISGMTIGMMINSCLWLFRMMAAE